MTSPRGRPWHPPIIAVVLFAVLVASSGGYGWFRDELYFRALGRHPAIAYPDVPFFTPFVARLTTALGGDSLTAFRIWPAICLGGVALLSGSMCTMLGGDSRASTIATAAVATSPLALIFGHVFHYAAFDQLAWSAILWTVVHIVIADRPKLWVVVGLLGGLAYENKNLVVLLFIGLATSIAIVGPRSLLRSRWPAIGVFAAALIAMPNVWWQATHGWPEFALAQHIRDIGGLSQRLLVIPTQFALVGIPLAGLAIRGGRRLWREPTLRFLPVGFVVVLVLLILVGGKPYYASGFLPMFLAAGAAGTSDRPMRPLYGRLGFNAALSAVIALPLLPASILSSTPIPAIYPDSIESIGWPSFVKQVTSAFDTLPPDQQQRAIILTVNYGEAGALELLGHSRLRVFSTHNAYFFWGPPPEQSPARDDIAIAVGIDPAQLRRVYRDVEAVARIDNGLKLANQEQGHQIYICHDRLASWRTLWPSLKNYS